MLVNGYLILHLTENRFMYDDFKNFREVTKYGDWSIISDYARVAFFQNWRQSGRLPNNRKLTCRQDEVINMNERVGQSSNTISNHKTRYTISASCQLVI